MSDYLLIESRDPFESNDVHHLYDLAENLARAGNQVTVFLVQNGVFPARVGAAAARLTALAKSGVIVLAEEFSLRERGIGLDQLGAAVKPAPLERVIDALTAGAKTIWH